MARTSPCSLSGKLAFAAALVVHVLLQWTWITARLGRLVRPGAGRARVNVLLNLALFIAMAATIASGVMISEVAVPAVATPGAASPWRGFHGTATNFVVVLVGLHIAINIDWIVPAVRQWRRAR